MMVLKKEMKKKCSLFYRLKLPDKDILWCINYNRFHQLFLEEVLLCFINSVYSNVNFQTMFLLQIFYHLQAITTAVEKKFDSVGAEIVKVIFKQDELSRDVQDLTSSNMTLYEIAKHLPKSCKLENSRISQYFALMVDDQDKFVKKIGDSGGGTYAIDIKKCILTLCQHTIQSIIQEKYGSNAVRVCRLLLRKDHLEQKQIGELAMIPSKDAKELLYKLFSENVISMQEVAKSTDYAPSRTIYLFSVNLKQLSRTLLERCYQTIGNLMSRRQSEIQDHSRVLEKQDRMEATVMALKIQHGEEAANEALKELEELVTEADREQLRKLKLILNKYVQNVNSVSGTVKLPLIFRETPPRRVEVRSNR
ncbi:hypothetical protein QZH41_012346 [Actinostola sp. cb2023]|nr:hypothetical protein QZH41_012346 [Actinostola sp. cb2023]